MDAVRTQAPRRWTREEYEHMITAGVIHSGERVELIDGEILTMAAQGGDHVMAMYASQDTLQRAFGPGYHARNQTPIALDDMSEPEPDVAVVAGHYRDYRTAPATVLLMVEVADTTLAEDRSRKGSLYARNRLADYWIVNVVNRILEIYREPVPDAEARYSWSYRLVQRCGPEEYVSPLARPEARIRVADLLP